MADGLIRAKWSMFCVLRRSLSAELKEEIMRSNYDNSCWKGRLLTWPGTPSWPMARLYVPILHNRPSQLIQVRSIADFVFPVRFPCVPKLPHDDYCDILMLYRHTTKRPSEPDRFESYRLRLRYTHSRPPQRTYRSRGEGPSKCQREAVYQR